MLAKLYDDGDNDAVISKAFAKFEAVLNHLPGAMDFAYMAEINLGLNGVPFDEDRVRKGIRVLQEAMERGVFSRGSLLYCQGNGWLALREYGKARDAYDEALKLPDASRLAGFAAQCNKNMGAALEKLGAPDEAIHACYKRALELDPGLIEAHFALARWHHQQRGDYSSALEHFDQTDPRKGSALQISSVQGWRIELLFKTGDIGGAFREINNLLGEAGKQEWIWPWCARQVADFDITSVAAARKAIRFWNAYLHGNDRGTDAAQGRRLLCIWFIHEHEETIEMDYDDFRSEMLRFIGKDESNAAYLWDRIGHWAQKDGDWEEAERNYRKAYELEPEQYGYCLGTALNFLGRYRDALPILLPQAEKYQPDAMSWFQVALARKGVDDIEGCISAYRRALELDPDYDLAWFNLGGIYWNDGDITQATDIWKEAIKRFPDHELAAKLRRDLPNLFQIERKVRLS
uniref:Tetratricopeptide repeat-containing protein n=1 Tax=Candidatus Kentrum sp. LPFa TaxID=2126335 RepID=A0A450WXV7_9GAMM|nr:MAG: Tetratricopeptide repeat-containing protein [Candidatus Kentron sp. LPFa]VFK35238.1 MAG: Tetratricopeptide repeat-containing protein [Candidatus Kentron sp. LPFa]